jgi:outer membrane protein OmpA-like peptidoglycan-associated protein
MSIRNTLITIAAALALAACASPVPNDALVQAEHAYGSASQDPEVANNAPVMLYEAKKDLDLAQQTWLADEDDPRVDHFAYMASKRVQIARETASRRVADAQAIALGRERDQTVIEARSRQVDIAQIEADAARKREAEARATAADLERQLEELKAKKTDRGAVVTLGDVLFDFDRASLRSGAQQNLYRLVTFLNENTDREILIEGHTDSVGSDSYNLDLSLRRCESVRDFLVANGVSASRMAVRGFGKAAPIASNATEAGRQQNRRVEVVILDPGKKATREIGR